MVRELRPPAREPASSWLGRRSTMATSTPANANSPASIRPVGPAPVITTACSFIVPPFVGSCAFVVTDVLGYRCFTNENGVRKIEALYRLLCCGSTKADALLFGRLNWKLGLLV